MRLFALPDGVLNRKERAQWITMPFDLDVQEAPESIDSLGPDFVIASRRISWRRGRMYPLRSYDNEQ